MNVQSLFWAEICLSPVTLPAKFSRLNFSIVSSYNFS